MISLLPFVLIVFLVALFLRVNFIFYTAYILLGIYVVTRLWARRGAASVRIRRLHEPRSLLGDTVQVRLQVENAGLWPVPWLRLQDHLPMQMATPSSFTQVTSLLPREKQVFTYDLRG